MKPVLSDPWTYVSCTGIVEIHFGVENDYIEKKVDLYDYVRKNLKKKEKFDTKFFTKNKETGKQYWLYCIVCESKFYACENLLNHIEGRKHQKRSIESNQVQRNKGKSFPGRCQNDLRDRLLNGPAYPFLGLEFITEIVNPKNPKKDPQYTCR